MTAPDAGTVATAAARPSPSEPRPYRFPSFEIRELPNGLRLVVAQVAKLPVVTALAVVDAGAVCDMPGLEGLAPITARALIEGTRSMDGGELTARVEALGTALDAGADWDSAVVQITALATNLPAAFALFGEVLMAPAFPEREIERLKAERLAELLQLRAEPRGLADETFNRVVYTEGSRYGRPEGGDETSVAAITRADVERFHRERYNPATTTLILAGDISADDAEALVERTLGGWLGGAQPAPTPDATPAVHMRRAHLVAKSDAAQSELRVGHVGVPRTHPDYFPVTVMNAILGGLFSSRINLNLREEHAYTYGAHSGFDWRRSAGPFIVSTAVQSDVTDAATREILFEIDRMRAEPVTDAELSLATSYLDGVFPIRYETTSAIAGALANMIIYGLPEDYFSTYRERIRAVTTEQVLAAARDHLHADALQLVVVGDPAQVRAPLEALGFGPLTVYDTEGHEVES
jgi:zinc protease